MRTTTLASLAALLVSLTAACSSTTSGKGSTSTETATQTCADTADAFAKAAQRCGSDYQASYNAFVGSFGGCDKVVSIRDEASLRGTCLPSFSTISCADLTNAAIDATCKGQLLTTKSFDAPILPEGVTPEGAFSSVAGKIAD